ncbi:MAG: hypothetical protein NT038_04775 [Euryarchaeota archaeon]|nr:hypothetical protein [Euryarchaeota archaeon]
MKSKKVQFGLILIIGFLLLSTTTGYTLPFLVHTDQQMRDAFDRSKVDYPFRQGMVIMDEAYYQHLPRGQQCIKDVWIESDSLKIWLFYGGGCKVHEFALIGPSMFDESLPRQMTFFLAHDANNDHCKALIQEVISLDISMLKEKFRAQYHTRSGTITLQIEGWNQSLFYRFGYYQGISYPRNGSFLKGSIRIGVHIPYNVCWGETKLFIDNVFVNNATLTTNTLPNPFDPHGESEIYLFHDVDTMTFSEGMHEITIRGKHNEFIDSIQVSFYNESKVWHNGTIRNESRMRVPTFSNGSADYANATFECYWVIDTGMLEPIEWGGPILVYPINLPDEYKIDGLKIRYTMKIVTGYIPPIGEYAIELLSIDDFKRIAPQ